MDIKAALMEPKTWMIVSSVVVVVMLGIGPMMVDSGDLADLAEGEFGDFYTNASDADKETIEEFCRNGCLLLRGNQHCTCSVHLRIRLPYRRHDALEECSILRCIAHPMGNLLSRRIGHGGTRILFCCFRSNDYHRIYEIKR